VRRKLCLLIGVRTLSLFRSRHNIPPIFSSREIDGYKVPSKYTTDFLGMLYNYINDDIEMIFKKLFNFVNYYVSFQMKNME
jgi:hypothetical protein